MSDSHVYEFSNGCKVEVGTRVKFKTDEPLELLPPGTPALEHNELCGMVSGYGKLGHLVGTGGPDDEDVYEVFADDGKVWFCYEKEIKVVGGRDTDCICVANGYECDDGHIPSCPYTDK